MIAAVIAAGLVVASVAIGRTPLGALNFGLLQWFGVRLCASFDPDLVSDAVGRWWSRFAPPAYVPVSWRLLRWVCPLTGWRTPYQWIARRGQVTSVSPGLLLDRVRGRLHRVCDA